MRLLTSEASVLAGSAPSPCIQWVFEPARLLSVQVATYNISVPAQRGALGLDALGPACWPRSCRRAFTSQATLAYNPRLASNASALLALRFNESAAVWELPILTQSGRYAVFEASSSRAVPACRAAPPPPRRCRRLAVTACTRRRHWRSWRSRARLRSSTSGSPCSCACSSRLIPAMPGPSGASRRRRRTWRTTAAGAPGLHGSGVSWSCCRACGCEIEVKSDICQITSNIRNCASESRSKSFLTECVFRRKKSTQYNKYLINRLHQGYISL